MYRRLLDILVCPATKGKLVLKENCAPHSPEPLTKKHEPDTIDQPSDQSDSTADITPVADSDTPANEVLQDDSQKNKVENLELWSRSAGLAYPVIDGIPRMVESEARTLSNEEIATLKEPHA